MKSVQPHKGFNKSIHILSWSQLSICLIKKKDLSTFTLLTSNFESS